MNEFVRLRAKIHSYLWDDSAENKNACKCHKKTLISRLLKLP